MQNKFSDFKKNRDMMREFGNDQSDSHDEMGDWQDYWDQAQFTGRGYDTLPIGAHNNPKTEK